MTFIDSNKKTSGRRLLAVQPSRLVVCCFEIFIEQLLAFLDILWDQLLERVKDSSIGNYSFLCPYLLFGVHPQARHLIAVSSKVKQNMFYSRVGEHLASMGGDCRNDPFKDLVGFSARVECSIEET